jgi:hypothetical protein
VVLDIDVKNKRISLGMKQLEPNPWSSFTEKYNPGDIIRGKVRSITDYGVFVGIEEGVDGMVHKSDISLDPTHQQPGRALPQGRRGRGGSTKTPGRTSPSVTPRTPSSRCASSVRATWGSTSSSSAAWRA